MKNKPAPKTAANVAKFSPSRPRRESNFPVVVIGASAGGFNALLDFMERMPLQLHAAIFAVLHVSARSNFSYLIEHLQQVTQYKCQLASNREPIRPGHVYFAVPGVHMVISYGKIIFGTGPEENRFKPSIDILFRTAAVMYRERTVGIIMSGLLDDGVAGMVAIRRCGGLCIVQEPTEAEYPDMPLAVIDKMNPDHVLPAADMGRVIFSEMSKKRKAVKVPPQLLEEVEIAEKVLTSIDETRKIGVPALFTCPACGGVLFSIDDGNLRRYRCFTGHAFSERSLLARQSESIQTTLWIALRLLEERKKVLQKLPKYGTQERITDIDVHIQRLKNLLSDLQVISTDSDIPLQNSKPSKTG